jgi:cobyrinic acid a,c-diamide synthase
LDSIADVLANALLADVQPLCHFECQQGELVKLKPLADTTIGIAQDEAFSFIYPANIDCLTALGAQLHYFSPLHDRIIPQVDSLWFPGGYPELYIAQLSQNQSMKQSIMQHHKQGKKIYAECGGMMYLSNKLEGLDGALGEMVGVLAGSVAMTQKSGCQGMQASPLPEGVLRGHAHHRSTLSIDVDPIAFGQRTRSDAPGEAIYRVGGLTASYLHSYFPSNPEAVAALFSKC